MSATRKDLLAVEHVLTTEAPIASSFLKRPGTVPADALITYLPLASPGQKTAPNRASTTSTASAMSIWSTSLELARSGPDRSEEHTSELQSLRHLVCRL